MYLILIEKAPAVVANVPFVDRKTPIESCCVVATDQEFPSFLEFPAPEEVEVTATAPPALIFVGDPKKVVDPAPESIELTVADAPK